jgi:N-acetyltransferase 10
MQKIKKLQARGVFDADKEDPFELFVSSTQIRWCYYKETQKVLGNTYGMAVLQDFEAITPNILCRTIETVEGGGIVVLLLHTMSSLKQLYTLSMDVHDRFRTGAHQDVVGRFNERFILSLANCANCLVLDDELNVLPISRHAKNIAPLAAPTAGAGGDGATSAAVEAVVTEADRELQALKRGMASTALVGGLVNQCKTLDQAKAVLTFAEAISEKTLRSTVALTAGRGRGKSAALGLAIAAAVAYGYSNIFVTSPSPENLRTLFEFVFKGLEALAYKEHLDYEAVASTNPDFNKAIVRINVFRGHRQTVQYIAPEDADRLGQAELVVIDEAAAIPLPLVKRLLGPYLVFLASTVNGYEGTGRSLSLKLIQQLRQAQASAGSAAASLAHAGYAPGAGPGSRAYTTAGAGGGAGALPGGAGGIGGRTLREVLLSEPIRYAAGDPIEGWLNDLLCLDATTPYRLAGRLPAPSECELFAVDRDALFSYHKVSEGFLHRMMSLYVSSHYKNSPNDLQLMSDAPAHKLFVLLGPQTAAAGAGAGGEPALPDVLCVLQVCLEGEINRDALKAALARGARSSGDLIPWTLAQQFQEDQFASLSGARVVRIATHPDATKMGYGGRALTLLSQFYSGQLVTVGEGDDDEEEGGVLDVDRGLHRAAAAAPAAGAGGKGKAGKAAAAADEDEEGGLASERVKPRKELPPLLVNVGDIRRPARLHWLGVSYGLTLQLFNFWRRGGYAPVYLRQTANELTAEHTMIMLRELGATGGAAAGGVRARRGWLSPFVGDFARRYMSLLSYEFRAFDTTLALSVMDAACSGLAGGRAPAAAAEEEEEGSGSAAGAGKLAAAAPASDAAGAAGIGAGTGGGVLSRSELGFVFTPHDLKRLESYSRNQVDYHLIVDLLPALARLYFSGRLPAEASVPRLQAGILLAMGLQHVGIEAVAAHFDLAENQVLALFHKALRKMSTALSGIEERAVAGEVDAEISAANAKAKAALAASKLAIAAANAGAGAGAGAAAKAPKSASKEKEKGAAAAAPAGASSAVAAALMADKDLAKYAVPKDTSAWDAALAAAASSAKKTTSRLALEAEGAASGSKRRRKAEEEEAASSASSRSDDSSDGSSSESEDEDSDDEDRPAVPSVLRVRKDAPASSDGGGKTLSGSKRKHGDRDRRGRHGGAQFAAGEVYDAGGRLSKGGKHKTAKGAR